MRLVTIDLDKLKYTNMTGTKLGWVNEVDISNAIVKNCGDAISRQAVDNIFQSIRGLGEDTIVAIYEHILDLPSVQPKVVPIAEVRFYDDKLHEIVDEAVKNIEIKSEWIPVSEKLPEKFIDVVVWYACPFSDEQWYGIGYLKENGKWDVDGKSGQEVLAWMPLPEPYKESNKTEQGLAYADQETMMPAT